MEFQSELHKQVDDNLMSLAKGAQEIFAIKQKTHEDRWVELSKNQLLNIIILKANRLVGRQKRAPEEVREECEDIINYITMYFTKVVRERESDSQRTPEPDVMD